MLGSRAFPCHKTSRTRLTVPKEGVYPRVCPVCYQEWVVTILPMLTAKGLKIGWLKREEHLRILKAVKDHRAMEDMEREFGMLKADLSNEIARVAAVTESEALPDTDDTVIAIRSRERRTRSVKPVEANGMAISTWFVDTPFDADERDLNTILAQKKIARDVERREG